MNIVIIGRGNVATNLHYAFTKKGIACQMVSSREGLDQLPSANVYIYAVKDEALAEVVASVKGKERAMHLHTSGSMPISVLLWTSASPVPGPPLVLSSRKRSKSLWPHLFLLWRNEREEISGRKGPKTQTPVSKEAE